MATITIQINELERTAVIAAITADQAEFGDDTNAGRYVALIQSIRATPLLFGSTWAIALPEHVRFYSYSDVDIYHLLNLLTSPDFDHGPAVKAVVDRIERVVYADDYSAV